MKNNLFSFLYFLTITALSIQNMNAAECKQCMILRNDLSASLLEQTRLATQNLELTNRCLKLAQADQQLSNEYGKLEQQYDRLASLNKQLISSLEYYKPINQTNNIKIKNKETLENYAQGFYLFDYRV